MEIYKNAVRLSDWDVYFLKNELGEKCHMVMTLMEGDTRREYFITPKQARFLAQSLLNAELDWTQE